MSVYALRSRRIAGSSGVSSTGWRRLSHDWLCCQHRILKCTALTKEGVEKTFLRNRRLYEWNKARRRWAHTIPVLASLSIPCPLLPFVQGQDSEGHREHNRSAIVTPVAGSGCRYSKQCWDRQPLTWRVNRRAARFYFFGYQELKADDRSRIYQLFG